MKDQAVKIADDDLNALIINALNEDLRDIGDITSKATIGSDVFGSANIIAKQNGIIAGQFLSRRVFEHVNPDITYTEMKKDGKSITYGDCVAHIEGPAQSILTAERTALNFLGRLSGVATTTALYTAIIKHTRAKILDTRKTTPGLREIQKYAVRIGGGSNHRMGLFDMFLIKENHIRVCGSIKEAVQRCKSTKHTCAAVEVETTNLDEVKEALEAGADRIMLDNMDIDDMKECVDYIAGRVEVEASGNISLDTIKAVAETGVDFISVGAITHSAFTFDYSLLFKVNSQ